MRDHQFDQAALGSWHLTASARQTWCWKCCPVLIHIFIRKSCLGENAFPSCLCGVYPSTFRSPAPLFRPLILQKLLHFYSLEGKHSQSVSALEYKGRWVEPARRRISSAELRLRQTKNRSRALKGPSVLLTRNRQVFPNGCDSAASVKEAQLFTAGHFRGSGGGRCSLKTAS